MNNKKCRGSLAIKPGRTGILRYRPLDRDLAVQIGSAQVLIERVDSGSSGPGQRGRGARVSDRASASGSRAGVDVRGPGGSEGERERGEALAGGARRDGGGARGVG